MMFCFTLYRLSDIFRNPIQSPRQLCYNRHNFYIVISSRCPRCRFMLIQTRVEWTSASLIRESRCILIQRCFMLVNVNHSAKTCICSQIQIHALKRSFNRWSYSQMNWNSICMFDLSLFTTDFYFRYYDRFAKFITVKLRHRCSAFVKTSCHSPSRGGEAPPIPRSCRRSGWLMLSTKSLIIDQRLAVSHPRSLRAGAESDGDRMYSDESAASELWVGKMAIAYSHSRSRWGGEENARSLRWVILRNRTGISSFRKAGEAASEACAGVENVFRLESSVCVPALLRRCEGIRGISAFGRKLLRFVMHVLYLEADRSCDVVVKYSRFLISAMLSASLQYHNMWSISWQNYFKSLIAKQ